MTANNKTGAPASHGAYNFFVVIAISLAALGLIGGIIHLSFPYRISQLQRRFDDVAASIGFFSSAAAIIIGIGTRLRCRPAYPGDISHRWHGLICGTSVIAGVIGILLNLTPSMHSFGGSNVASTRVTLANVSVALEMYHEDTGSYPTTLQGLNAPATESLRENWKGPYIHGGVTPPDAWGNRLRYRLVDGKPDLRSAGPDGTFDTADDILPMIRDK